MLIAGDRRATTGYLIAQRDLEKAHPADDLTAVAFAGTVGLAVDLVKLYQVELTHFEKAEGVPMPLAGKATRLATMIRNNLGQAMQGLAVVPLLAGYDPTAPEDGRGRLFSFGAAGGRYERFGFHAEGSGSPYARGAWKKLFRPGMSRREAALAALQALYDAADDDSATGGSDITRRIYPIVSVITEDGFERLAEAETEELSREVVEQPAAGRTGRTPRCDTGRGARAVRSFRFRGQDLSRALLHVSCKYRRMARGCAVQPSSRQKDHPPMTAAPESTPPLPAPASARRTAWHRVRTSMTRQEWIRVGGMAAFILALHVIGWFTLVAVVAPEHRAIGTQTFGVGIGVTAYTLGMRHAFDADHIAAIDNTTRKLMGQGQRPLSVGYWFSLGHSSVVFVLAFLLTLGVKTLAGPVRHDGSVLHNVTGLIGTTVSGTFLYLIAAVNLVILAGIWKVFRAMRSGRYDEAALEEQLDKRGFMNRLLGRAMKSVSKPWQTYPLGILFGLGFDTATEIALLVLAGSGAASGLPWYAILCLPVLFAAGMCLLDTIDGSFMNFAYGWAFSKPVRKVYYNLTITGLSVAVALLIGTVELLGLLTERFGLHGPFWGWISGLDLNILGYAVVALFVATWVVALLVWRFGRIEEKWTTGLLPADRTAD